VKIVVALLASAALALGVAAPAAAGTATNGVLTISATDQVMQSACYHYQNMTYSVTSTTPWTLNVDVLKAGAVGGSDYASGDGVAAASGLLSAFLCDSLDGPGTYTVRAVLTSYDGGAALPNVETSTTFELTAPVVAPTPVVKVATRIGIAIVSRSGHQTHKVRRGNAAYVGTRLLRGTSTWVNGARVTLQAHRAHRAWGNIATRTTATKGGFRSIAVVKVRPASTTFYRWIYRGNSTSQASASRVSKIRVTR
jgi:hypothetical protein